MVPADHHRDQLVGAGLRDLPGADVGAVAQHRDPVREHEHLLEAVADVDDADAALAQPADDAEQAQDVGLGERRGGLVHDQDARVLGQRLGDLDPLPVADRERADDARDVEVVDVERGEQILRAWARIAAQSRAPRRVRGAWPMKMFSATLSSGNSSSSWKIVAIPARWASCGLAKRTSSPSRRMVPASG